MLLLPLLPLLLLLTHMSFLSLSLLQTHRKGALPFPETISLFSHDFAPFIFVPFMEGGLVGWSLHRDWNCLHVASSTASILTWMMHYTCTVNCAHSCARSMKGSHCVRAQPFVLPQRENEAKLPQMDGNKYICELRLPSFPSAHTE